MKDSVKTYRCDECGKEFVPVKPWQKFHDAHCRDRFWIAARKLAAASRRRSTERGTA